MRRLRPDSGARDETLRRLRRKSQSSRAADIKIIREITRDFFPFYGERKFEKKNKTKQKKRTKTARMRGGKKNPSSTGRESSYERAFENMKSRPSEYKIPDYRRRRLRIMFLFCLLYIIYIYIYTVGVVRWKSR